MAMQTMVLRWTSPSPPRRPWVTRKRLAWGGVGLTCSALAAGFHGASCWRARGVRGSAERRRPPLHPLLVEALAGAIGEVVQVAVLYPLDTIKVKCQAHGLGSQAMVRSLCTQRMGLVGTVRRLYAGCGPATACAAFVGAVYLVSFFALKRLSGRALVGLHHWKTRQEPKPGQQTEELRTSPPATAIEAAESPPATLAASMVSSIATSILEAPAELFRHRLQAGVVEGGMLGNMAAALSGGGLRSLYGGYTAFMLKGIPYDVAELFTYSQLAAMQKRMPAARCLPHYWSSIVIGAVAGAAAVLASMPADCIKLRMALAPAGGGLGVAHGLVQFVRTGRGLVAVGGVGSLFVGCVPRMAEKVPSTMLYWLTVDCCRRFLREDGSLLAEPRHEQSH